MRTSEEDSALVREIWHDVVGYLEEKFLYDSTSQAQESRKLMRKAAYLYPRFKSGFLDMETSIIYELKQGMVQFSVICMQPILIIHIL